MKKIAKRLFRGVALTYLFSLPTGLGEAVEHTTSLSGPNIDLQNGDSVNIGGGPTTAITITNNGSGLRIHGAVTIKLQSTVGNGTGVSIGSNTVENHFGVGTVIEITGGG